MICGGDGSSEFSVCIPSSLNRCPITKIVIAETNPNPEEFKEKVEILDDTKNSVYISRTNGVPILEAKADLSG